MLGHRGRCGVARCVIQAETPHESSLTAAKPVEPIDGVHFYRLIEYCDDVSKRLCEYVRKRWPIITFSLDPVTDQQNIADSFSLNRDLQPAVSFAFATGQINFSQLNPFRRQIQRSSDTIALNRTTTGSIQGNDTFGFR